MTNQVVVGAAALTLSDLNTSVNHEPRIRDLRLAEVLGMADHHAIRRLIKRHMQVLESLGEMVSDQDRKPPTGGRPSHSFYLSKRQALFLTAKADTPRAAMVTVEMVELFDRFTSGNQETQPSLALTEHEIMMVRAFRAQLEQATAPAIIRGVNAEIARLRTDTSKALQIAMDVVVLREMERRGEMG